MADDLPPQYNKEAAQAPVESAKFNKETAPASVDSDKEMTHDDSSHHDAILGSPEMPFTSTAKSFGVRKVELMVDVFPKQWQKGLYYFAAFLCAYAYALDGTLRYTLQIYATDSYKQHSLYVTVNVIRSVVAAAAQPTYARLSDAFGRLEIFAVAIVLYIVGTIIESQAWDVQRFAAGAVLYQIGYSGVQLILEVALSDMSNLNWRLFASFIPALPFIINTWASGDMLEELLARYGWSFPIGMWAFIFPLASIPLLACMIYMRVMAGKTAEWKQIAREEKEHLVRKRVLIDLFWELDVIGVLLIICVFGFILVPFTLAGNKTGILIESSTAWDQAYIIAPLCVGVVLIPALVFWEWKGARFPIIPFNLLKDRGVWAALLIGCLINFIWYMPNDYMYTVLVAGMNATTVSAQRITSLYSFVSVITGPLLGLVIVKVRRTKGFILFGCCMWFLAMGLLLHFRGDNDGISARFYEKGVIGGLCVMGFGAGFFTYTTQVSIQTCTNHEYMAVVISLYLASYNIGSALGSAVSGAVWTQLMPGQIRNNMIKLGVDVNTVGESGYTLDAEAYSAPLTFILTNEWGTPARRALVLSYAVIQKKMCIIGLCLCVLLLAFAFCLRDHYLPTVQSLDEEHRHDEGIHGQKPAIDDVVVVNDYDNDPIASFIRGIFKRSQPLQNA